MERRLLFVFLAAFLLNLLWENLHEVLYVHYQGGEITRLILFRAALFDAAFITALAVPMLFVPWLRKRLYFSFIFGVIFAVILEWFALKTGRWEYTAAMPLVPFLQTGLSPTVQLGITGWVSHALAKRYFYPASARTRADSSYCDKRGAK